jgi:NTE family protein
VLSVLEAEHIPIDFVTGTSVGALIGAAYCAGVEVSQLIELAKQFRWRSIASLTWPKQGLLSFAKLEQWLVAQLGDLDFSELSVPLAVVATDLEDGQPITLREQRLAPAVHASCAVPGLVKPVSMHGRRLVDGGVSDNLPVSAARAMGADYVIAVDICRPTYRPHWGPLGVATHALETMIRHSGGGYMAADCLISPDLTRISYFRFSRRHQLISRGAAAAEEKIPAIRAALAPRQ